MELQPKSNILLSINEEPVTESADVDTRLEERINREGAKIEEVIIDCAKSAVLQGSKGRSERRVQINRYGEGKQTLSPTETLVVKLTDRKRPEPRKEYWAKVDVDQRTLADPRGTRKEWQRIW